MLKTILISLVAFCIATGLHAQMDSVFFDGAYRHYALHFPPQYDGSTPLPLVICLHGGFGSGLQFEEQSTLSEKSDEAGFVAVYPNGTGYLLAPNLRFWNAGNCCGYAEEQNIDDVGFIEAMIDALVADYAIDATRVYSTGISNGAFMSYRLACELSDKIAAIAPVAGGMLVDECLPSSSVPIIHFQSFLDTSNPYTGGVGDGVGTHDNPPLDSVFTVWANTNLCTNLADTISVSEEYTHVRWNNCECNRRIDYYITEDGGHSWPGGTSPAFGDPVSEVIDANDFMWDFFLEFTTDCQVNSVSEMRLPETLIYPNPASNYVWLECTTPAVVTAYDLSGRSMLVKTIKSGKTKLDISGLEPGSYLFSTKADGQINTHIVVVSGVQ